LLPITVHPNARRFYYFSPLGPCDSLERTPESRSAPSFDLDEGNQMTAPDHQVQLDSANAKAVRDDFPPAALEIPHRLLFAGEPPLMPGVAPIRWIAMNAARHSDKLCALPTGQ